MRGYNKCNARDAPKKKKPERGFSILFSQTDKTSHCGRPSTSVFISLAEPHNSHHQLHLKSPKLIIFTMPRTRPKYDDDDDLDYSYGSSPPRTSRGRSSQRHHRSSRHHKSRSRYRSPSPPPSYYSDSDADSYYSPPPRNRSRRGRPRATKRRSSLGNLFHRNRSPDDSYEYDSEDERQFARARTQQAFKSALTAGAVEAIRQRNRPGEWLGERGLRVATAAMSAAAIDTAVENRRGRSRGRGGGGGLKNVLGSSLGGLVVDKVASRIRGRSARGRY